MFIIKAYLKGSMYCISHSGRRVECGSLPNAVHASFTHIDQRCSLCLETRFSGVSFWSGSPMSRSLGKFFVTGKNLIHEKVSNSVNQNDQHDPGCDFRHLLNLPLSADQCSMLVNWLA